MVVKILAISFIFIFYLQGGEFVDKSHLGSFGEFDSRKKKNQQKREALENLVM